MNCQWLRLQRDVVFSILGLLLLGACSTEIDPALQKEPTFVQGYSDGCATANTGVSDFKNALKRNDDLYDQDKAYKAGWNDGYSSCGGNMSTDKDVFGSEDRWYTNGPINP